MQKTIISKTADEETSLLTRFVSLDIDNCCTFTTNDAFIKLKLLIYVNINSRFDNFFIRSKMLAFIAPAVDLMLLNENRIPPTIKVQQSHDFPKFNIPRGYHFSLKRLLNLPAFVTSAGASICLQSPSLPPTLLPSLPLPLEVGPLNPVKGSGGALWAPQWGLGWKPQPPTILVHVQGEGTLLVAQYNLTSNYRFCSVARLLWGSKP